MLRTTILSIAIVMGAAAVSAQSSNESSRVLANFEKLDTNGDDLISRSEYSQARAARWSQIDRNGDGFLSTDDFPRFATRRAEQQIEQMRGFDTNGDGKISQDEFVNGPMPAFDQTDQNGDGSLTQAELETVAQRR